MKKLFSALLLTGALTMGCLMPSAEALDVYEDGHGASLVFSDSLNFDSGFVMKVNPRSRYLGTWERQTNGKINILFDEEYVKDEAGKIVSQSSINMPFYMSKNQNTLLGTYSANSTAEPVAFHRCEYVWGNDVNLAKYMLTKLLKSQAQYTFDGKVEAVASRTKLLDANFQPMLKRNEQNATGPGHWFKVTTAGSSKYFYVESDPRILYEQYGDTLDMIEADPRLTYLENRTAAYPMGSNRARVVMFKDRTTEYYEIFFTPVYFIVEKASADDPNVAAELQKEVGIRQNYGPNPRVNLVRETFSCDK